MRVAVLAFSTVMLAASSVFAIDVERRVEYDTSAAEVWALVGPFCAIADWHPVIAKCEIEDIGGVTHRHLTTGDGGMLLEKQTAHDDATMSYAYDILESPLPVANYRSVFKVEEAGAGAAIVWTSTFDAAGATDAEAAGVIGGIYDAGLAEVEKILGE